ncbi:unnamed protein product [Knipowitschia caucasica]|uniref:E2F/DP family winged-helix DNA-binding domain-containing protein n=1 Tax=Knipowitschia caucasica TaxID=637954 RepID=A0AAV2KB21_KNICA
MDPDESTERDPDESTERDPDESTERDPDKSTERTSEEASGAAADAQSSPLPQRLLSPSWEQNKDTELELDLLTPQFLELLLNSDGCVDILRASSILRTQSRRLYDITAVLRSLQLVKREATRVRWTGLCPISSFLWPRHKLQRESEKLKLVEETLDGLIKTCAQQLFTMTDDASNAHSAYVTLADVQQLPVFQNQTVIVVRAPEETKLEVPSPTKDQIQVQLKSGSGPISVFMCDVWPQEATSSKFELIQKSRIQTSQLV